MRSLSEGVATDFTADPHLIPQELDAPLMASDQSLLMEYHEQLRHTSFAQLQELAKQGIIPRNWPMCLHRSAPAVSTGKPTRSHGGHTRLIPRSSQQPFLVLWSALTNWNPQSLVLSRLQRDNQQPAATEVPACLLTM